MASIQAANGATKLSKSGSGSRSVATRFTPDHQPEGPTVRRKTRSAVTNGKRLFVQRPGDTAWAHRFRDVLNEIISDLGGADILSEGQRQLARRAATLAVECERLEGEMASGREADLHRYGQLTDRIGRTFHCLGLITPTLGQLIRADQDAERQRLARRKHEEPE
jgi:hypothetical protein